MLNILTYYWKGMYKFCNCMLKIIVVVALIYSSLKNDDISEMLDLEHSINSQPFPCQYIKIGISL